jgi:hypothetical protein
VRELGSHGSEDAFDQITRRSTIRLLKFATPPRALSLIFRTTALPHLRVHYAIAGRSASADWRRHCGIGTCRSGHQQPSPAKAATALTMRFRFLFLMSKSGELNPLMRAIEEHPSTEARPRGDKALALSGQPEVLPAFRRLAVRALCHLTFVRGDGSDLPNQRPDERTGYADRLVLFGIVLAGGAEQTTLRLLFLNWISVRRLTIHDLRFTIYYLRLCLSSSNPTIVPVATTAGNSRRSRARVRDGAKDQVLLGITGSGKTFTVAAVIERDPAPTLVIAHNKTLAAQLYQEFRSLFPKTPSNTLFLTTILSARRLRSRLGHLHRKGRYVNEDIDRLRMSATRALFRAARRDRRCQRLVHLRPRRSDAYYGMLVFSSSRMRIARDTLLQRLVELQYDATISISSAAVFVCAATSSRSIPAIRTKRIVSNFGAMKVDSISTIDPLLGEVSKKHTSRVPIYPKITLRNAAHDLEARASNRSGRTSSGGSPS